MTGGRKLSLFAALLVGGAVVISGMFADPMRNLLGIGVDDKRAASGGISAGIAAPITDPLRNALSGIDYVANRAHLDELLGAEAASELILIARDNDDDVDPGLRIRAYMALSLYPADTLGPLLDAVDEHTTILVTEGMEIVLAKAAMASIAIVARSLPVSQKLQVQAQLNQALGHPVADLRASAARALGRSGIDSARPLLESKALVETHPLVREAIRRALLDLGRF